MKTSFHFQHRHQKPRRVRSLADRWAARKRLLSHIAYVCALGATRFFEKKHHTHDGLTERIVDMVPEDRAFLIGEDMYDTSEELKGPKGPLGHLPKE